MSDNPEDPTELRWKGEYRDHLGMTTPFDVPYLTRVPGMNLLHGGAATGLFVPNGVTSIVSVTDGDDYYFYNPWQTMLHAFIPMEDGEELPNRRAIDVAVLNALYGMSKPGDVVVHCTAGLNRSSLVVGAILVGLTGMTNKEAVKFMRSYRSPAVLCNPVFHDWFLEQKWTHGSSPS